MPHSPALEATMHRILPDRGALDVAIATFSPVFNVTPKGLGPRLDAYRNGHIYGTALSGSNRQQGLDRLSVVLHHQDVPLNDPAIGEIRSLVREDNRTGLAIFDYAPTEETYHRLGIGSEEVAQRIEAVDILRTVDPAYLAGVLEYLRPLKDGNRP